MTLASTPAQLSIRSAELADAPQITAVINAAFRIAEEFFIDGNRITQAEVEESLAKGVFLLAEVNGKLNGCVYVELRGERSYLGLLSVDPACQQGGLGSRLMSEAENYCRERGSRGMDILIVSLGLATRRLYLHQRRSPNSAPAKRTISNGNPRHGLGFSVAMTPRSLKAARARVSALFRLDLRGGSESCKLRLPDSGIVNMDTTSQILVFTAQI